MRGQANGRWVEGAINSMLLPNRAAAAVLHGHGGSACTDVTGFGLLGHLLEMIQYEDTGLDEYGVAEEGDSAKKELAESQENAVVLTLKNIPTLVGAVDCVRAGILSSLQPQVLNLNLSICIVIVFYLLIYLFIYFKFFLLHTYI